MKRQKKNIGILLAFCVSIIVLFCMGCEVPKALEGSEAQGVSSFIELNELEIYQRSGCFI